MIRRVIMVGSLLLANVIPSGAFAAGPVVGNIAGAVTHGQAITIGGSNFGVHPNYNASSDKWKGSTYLNATFKDFEDNSISSQGFSVNDASDISIQNGGPSNSTKFEQMRYGNSRLANYGFTQSGNNTGSLYTSFWFMMPSGTEGGKPWRWYFGPNSSNDNLYLGTQCGSVSLNLGGDMLANAGYGAVYGNNITPGTWHKLEIYASEPNAIYRVWLDGSQYLDFTASKGANPFSATHTMSPDGHTVETPDMIDGTTCGCATTGSYNYDDMYSDYTPARVEICTGSTWANRGVCNTQIPTSWSTTSISAIVNMGTFTAGSAEYLYVVDNTNTANTNGVAVTFGSSSSGGDTTPPVISSPLPSGTLAYGTTSASMSVTTNETATCKYGTSNVAYASLPNTFSATGGTSHSQNLSSLVNGGSYTYYVRCIDGSSNADTTSTVVSFTVSNTPPVNNTPPTASITTPSSGATVSGNTTITATATATGSATVAKVDFYVDSTTTPVATATSSPYTFTWNTAAVANGSHTIYAKSTDSSGNTSNPLASVSVTVSNKQSTGAYTAIFGNTSDASYPNTVNDTFIDINTTVNATSTLISTYTWPANTPCNAILMQWNLSALPANAQIQSATLQLYMNYMEGSGGDSLYTIPVHKLINKSPVISKASGYYYDGTNPWDPSSVPYNSIPLAQADVAAPVDTQQINMTYGYKSWDVTSIVKDWVATPASNFGLLLNGSSVNSADSNRGFGSSRASDPTQRPKLVVTYTVGGPLPVKNVKASVISTN